MPPRPFSAPASSADPDIIPDITVMTIVKWSGTDCTSARGSSGQRDLCDTVGTSPNSEAIVEHGKAVGDLVGVDPAMGHADWIGYEMYLNGSPHLRDAAVAGDGSDVTCLHVLQ